VLKYLEEGSILQYVLSIYGAFLVMLCMGGLFFFFTSFRISTVTLKAGICFMVVAIFFYLCDNMVAQNKFNKNPTFVSTFSKSLNAYLLMISYYKAQFLIGKGAFMVCVYFISMKENIVKRP